MHPLLSAVCLVGLTTHVHAAAHYAPTATNINNLTFVVNGTGTNGIYNTSYTPENSYGEYNWCNMPHARSTEYKVPARSEYQLEYVEVIHRHHKRTPYASNTFFIEDISWDCTGEGPYYYGQNATGVSSDVAPVSWQAAYDDNNPFTLTVGPGFVNTTCQLPQITDQGLVDSLQHGIDLRSVYHDTLGFLPEDPYSEEVSFRVTNNQITSMVLAPLVKGLYPSAGSIVALIQSDTYDSLEPAYSCPTGSAIRSEYQSTPAWYAHLDDSVELYAILDSVSGIATDDTAGWHTWFDHYFDNLSAKQCHQKSLPCSVNDTSLCVTQSDADAVYRRGQYEYSFIFRDATNSTLYSALTYGAFFLELKARLQARISGTSPLRYRHNIAHDGSLSPLLGILQVDVMVWPGMGSEVIFELWKKSQEYFVRVLWGGQPMQTSTPLGTLDMINVNDFIEYIDTYIPSGLPAACNAS